MLSLEIQEWVLFSAYRLEEYGSTSQQDWWCAPELDGALPSRKEREIVDMHKQDQGGIKENFLDPLPGGKLKLMIKNDSSVLEQGGPRLKMMETEAVIPGKPWWFSLNEALESM